MYIDRQQLGLVVLLEVYIVFMFMADNVALGLKAPSLYSKFHQLNDKFSNPPNPTNSIFNVPMYNTLLQTHKHTQIDG